jgi:chaperone modulatory protein CbpM
MDSRTTFTFNEFAQVCGVERSLIIEMVDEGVIEPIVEQGDWCFHGESLVRAKQALRLVRDLGVNWPGAALALDLIAKLEGERD